MNSESIKRLKEYQSWIKSTDSIQSDYWDYHSGLIDIKFYKSFVLLYGESGFYFPQKLNFFNQFKNFMRLFPTRLSYYIFKFYGILFSRPTSCLSTYHIAYENIWEQSPTTIRPSHSINLEFKGLDNKVLNFRTIKEMMKVWPESKTHILSEVTIQSYYHLQLMESVLQNLRGITVCEIGSGTGNLASLFFYHFSAKLFLVDLPKTLLFSFSHLSQTIPNAKILLPNEIEAGNCDISKYDIIMMTPDQTSIIPDKTVNLTINTHSMQEMKKTEIDFYYKVIDRIIKPNGHFFSNNRVEKIMSQKPIRFSEYPWRDHTRTIFFEIDPLSRLVKMDSNFIRMEQYP